jgi:signal transduction histidine kinase
VSEESRGDSELLDAQRELRALADEQAALRRVATLVARGAPQDEVFAAVGREAGALLGADGARIVRYAGDGLELLPGWSATDQVPLPVEGRIGLSPASVSASVLRTGAMTRVDDYADNVSPSRDDVRRLGIQSAVGAPIVVGGEIWGAVIAWLTRAARLPEGAEARLAGFTELVATTVSNAANRAELDRVLAEQAALRRVATLIARETPPDVVLGAVAREVGANLGADGTHLARYDGEAIVSVAHWGRYETVPLGARFPLDGDSISARVRRTGAPARIDGYVEDSGAIAGEVRRLGLQCSVGVPIAVEGRLWGVMIAAWRAADAFPPDAEARLHDFTELVATAISNASTRNRVRELADEQAALRRVATLVAEARPEAEIFATIAEEITWLLGVDSSGLLRFEEERFATVVASTGRVAPVVPVGLRLPIEGSSVTSAIVRTGTAARLDDYSQATGPWAERIGESGVRSVVGTPVMVSGHLWGAMMAITHEAPLPPDTEARIAQFTDLMATAIANAEARTEVARLAEEQVALRRVATLVAEGGSPSAVFDAVTAEVAELLGASSVTLARYEGEHLVVLATRGAPHVHVGDRYPDGGTNVTRAPIVVDGRTWGVLAAVWSDAGPPPEDTEERLAKFTRLLDTAIANADSRDQLTASRARVLAAADEARRRVVRDLHDGAQQRLVQTIVTLKLARQDRDHADELTTEALETAERAMVELRELAHGILPAALTRGGLRAGVAAFVARLDLPVELDVTSERLHPDIEASAYFIVAEALTNVVKHAGATRATVSAAVQDGALTLEVADDGVGGADPEGHGLVGIADRVAAHGGGLRIDSEDGTALSARLPL